MMKINSLRNGHFFHRKKAWGWPPEFIDVNSQKRITISKNISKVTWLKNCYLRIKSFDEGDLRFELLNEKNQCVFPGLETDDKILTFLLYQLFSYGFKDLQFEINGWESCWGHFYSEGNHEEVVSYFRAWNLTHQVPICAECGEFLAINESPDLNKDIANDNGVVLEHVDTWELEPDCYLCKFPNNLFNPIPELVHKKNKSKAVNPDPEQLNHYHLGSNCPHCLKPLKIDHRPPKKLKLQVDPNREIFIDRDLDVTIQSASLTIPVVYNDLPYRLLFSQNDKFMPIFYGGIKNLKEVKTGSLKFGPFYLSVKYYPSDHYPTILTYRQIDPTTDSSILS